MARWSDGDRDWGATGKCHFCEQPPAAFWHGADRPFEVCRDCAENVLPALIADAQSAMLFRQTDGWRSVVADRRQAFDRVETRFWNAVAHDLEVARRDLVRELESARRELSEARTAGAPARADDVDDDADDDDVIH